jgi:thioredoxin 1
MDRGYLAEAEAPTRDEVDHMPGVVLVEFGAPDCGYCRALAPQVQALLKEHPDVRHVKIEDGPGQALGRSFQVRLWPNLVFLRDGALLRQMARPTASQLKEAFALAAAPSARA